MARLILIIDDTPNALSNFREMLDQNGWCTVSAWPGAEAVAKATTKWPSRILVGYRDAADQEQRVGQDGGGRDSYIPSIRANLRDRFLRG
jgi:CheY-like chemotaxis protein